MKNDLTRIPSNFDSELLSILKSDIQEQRSKVKAKLISMATKAYDNELLNILREDLNFLKSQICNASHGLAQAS
ncbi:hypothetical protein I5M32_14825 [Pedobacter sp. SD-b]|uniref:Uncharacterized protein n=1 Tax=Pedobacter segetis TaxID=2793069 RepID=A0ABS1BMX4_9SPHI|nr:hypothetical protein [Pedobacter segetis]MBK0384239.1 hypothetical protein [Pedobacter segetis]